jgi:hypothetical protein
MVRPVPGACLCKLYQAHKAPDEFTAAEIAAKRPRIVPLRNEIV